MTDKEANIESEVQLAFAQGENARLTEALAEAREALAVERACRLNNEKELHRADRIIGDLRERLEAFKDKRSQEGRALREAEATIAKLMEERDEAKKRVQELESLLKEYPEICPTVFETHSRCVRERGHDGPCWGI